MKMKLLLAALLFSFHANAQQPDTVGVARQVDSLNQVSYGLMRNRKFTEAYAANESAERIAMDKMGKESAEYARAISYRGGVFMAEGKYDESVKFLLEAKILQEKLLGQIHPDYAFTLYLLGNNHYYKSNFSEAISALSESLSIRETTLGKAHKDYGESLYFLGFVLKKIGDIEKAEPIILEYKAFVENKYGKEHAEYAKSLIELSSLQTKKAAYDKAQNNLLEALSVQEKATGKSNAVYALILNYLGNLYLQIGEYGKSEEVLLEAASIQKAIMANPIHYAITLNNLGQIYTKLENYDKAEPFFLEAIELYENKIGTKSPNYEISLKSLAVLYVLKGSYDKAEKSFQKSLSIKEKTTGKDNPEYAMNLANLAGLYMVMSNYPKAEQTLLESKSILEKLAFQEHMYYAVSLSNLGNLYMKTGQYKLAESLLLMAKPIVEKTTGKENGLYIEILNYLADVHWSQKNNTAVRPFLLEVIEGEKNQRIKSAQYFSEQELAAAGKKSSLSLSRAFSFAQAQNEISPACYDNILFQKGFLLNTVSQVAKLAGSNPASAEQYQLLQSYRRRLATEYSQPTAERDSARIAGLEEKANTLEKQLAREVAGYSEAIRQVKWPEVQAALQPGEVAIEFVDYQYFDPKPTDSIMYAALLIRPGDAQPQFIPLFEKKELLPLLRGATGGSNFLKINALYAAKPFPDGQKSPYELIWKPLEQALKSISTVYCSPSGLLHYLNLAAIPTPAGKPFGDTRHLVLLGSTRTLVIPNPGGPSARNDAYLAGGIRYESDRTALSIASRDAGTRSAEITGGPVFHPDSSATRAGDLNYLPATATEVREIGQMLRFANFSAKVDTGFFANEEAFRSLGIGQPSPRILHLATHGYFFPDPKGKKTKDFGQEPIFKMSEHPMIRSGLLMAGAKQAWLTGKHPEGQEDGILTAYEISQMNLSNTELVVLSACETGLGQVSGNEGVYGLQRAFKIAGAKYLIMSLWKVDDRSTAAFMAKFYQQWLQEKQSIPEAFRAAQQAMRTQSPNAYDWAGFVLIE